MKRITILATLIVTIFNTIHAQERGKPQDTEYYSPVPPVITPGGAPGDAPSDAIVLFDGKNLDQWVNSKDSTPAKWILADNVMTVNKSTGDIQTRATFTNYQLHIEYFIPANITGSGQGRGNSG